MNPQEAVILIVDDDQYMLDFLSEQLGQRGFKTKAVLSAGQAIEEVRRAHFDLVLCDLKMPLIDGVACMEILAQLAPSMRLIMMSGEATVDHAVNAMKKGAYDFLQKPIRMEQLLFLVEKALLKTHLDMLVALYRKSMDILSNLSVEEMLSPMLRTVANFFRTDRVCWMEQTSEGALKFIAAYGSTEAKARLEILACAERILRGAPDKKNLYLVADDPQRRAAAIPVFRDKSLRGVLVLSRPGTEENFVLSELRDAAQFASQIHETVESAQLRRAFEDKMFQLEKAYEALDESKSLLVQKEKMAQLGGMVLGVAHEINDPLQCVVGYTDLLLRQKDMNDEAKKNLSIVFDEARRCRDMVQTMLQYTRVHTPRFQWTHWRRIVSETLGLLAMEFRDRNVSVKVTMPADMPGLAADPDQLKQLLINLLKNAVEAMVELPEKHIEIEVVGIQETQRLVVKDNGPGIRPEYLQKVFEPHFTARDQTRSGIGLSVCSEIAQKHHGKISVQSPAGKGASFVVELPRSQPEIGDALNRAA